MKKLLLSFTLLASVISSHAQSDASAKDILNEVSKKYSAYQTMESDFTLSIQGGDATTPMIKGKMIFNKPSNQYIISLPDQEIMSDGKSVWNISKDIQEVQLTDVDHSENSIGPNNLFSFYQQGYNYQLLPQENIVRQGKTEKAQVIELKPHDSNTNYSKIKLRINKNNHIQDVIIYDKANHQFTYSIQSLYIGKKYNKSMFIFNKAKYKGYEIVDLR